MSAPLLALYLASLVVAPGSSARALLAPHAGAQSAQTVRIGAAAADAARASGAPDVVILRDGKELRGRVVLDLPSKLVLRASGKEREFAPAELAEVRSLERSQRELFEQFGRLARLGARGFATLATFCSDAGLPGEAQVLWLRALIADPEDERAWHELGGVHTPRGWRLVVEGRHATLDELVQRVSTDGGALAVTTTHFVLQGSARTLDDMRENLELALNLERAYLTNMDLLGRALALRVVEQAQRVHVYRVAGTYPAPPVSGDRAWFDREANTVHIDATSAAPGHVAYAQVARLLSYNALGAALGGDAALPAWLERGLAEHLAAAIDVSRGVARFALDAPWAEAFLQQARDSEPVALARLLTAGDATFERGKEASRSLTAAYTLVYFLMHADGGARAERFLAFVGEARQGRGAVSHLEAALGESIEALEARWRAFVAETAAR
ncbi:MAG: hypothetical protein R3F49_04510 [Planctomycetota bacterium]